MFQDGASEVPLSIQTVRRSSVFISEKEKAARVEKERPKKSEKSNNNVHFESSDG